LTNLTPSMRLKVNRDTFFLPEANNSVYFRNNSSSFRMEGTSIDKWVEKLLPMFNGDYTLADITKGLQGPYRNRVFEIADALYRNGYVRDVSQDHPHQLAEAILKKYGSQIEFLDSFGDSGAYRFQMYRGAKVLAIGSGPILVSLISALIESGLPKINVLLTNSVPTDTGRLIELENHARKTDPDVTVEVMKIENNGEGGWREIVKMFDSILYVSGDGNIAELRALHALCREEKKMFLPAISLQKVGFAGPLVHPDSEGCWESAWRRIHKTALAKDNHFDARSYVSEAMLANVIVFELFKQLTSMTSMAPSNQFYLLNLETMEGNWHAFIPHPLVAQGILAERVTDIDRKLENDRNKEQDNDLLLYFSQLTSEVTGIFHIWDEEDLNQLPLSQCYIQVVNPLSDGPAELMPKRICAGMTHREARRESGLTGIEEYVAGMEHLLFKSQPQIQELDSHNFIGVGTGESFAEAVNRGLQRCLDNELTNQMLNHKITAKRIQLSGIDDDHCLFYLRSITTLQGTAPIIALGEEVNGFPVVWLGFNGLWYGSVGLNLTLALRNAAQQALMKAQNNMTHTHTLEVSSIHLEVKVPKSVEIPKCEESAQYDILQSARMILKRNGKRLVVSELEVEPFLKGELLEVYGVLLQEEGSR
jgi:putative thiazole-containing bacteriocin maturation protein